MKYDLFNNLYSSYSDSIFAYFKICTGTDNAADLTQQTFLKVWDYIYKNTYNFNNSRAWIFKIAVNVKNDWLRYKYTHPSTVDLDKVVKADENFLADRDISISVQDALSALEIDTRELLVLRGAGLDSFELSKIYNISASAVRSRIAAAKKVFVEKLKEIGVDIDG